MVKIVDVLEKFADKSSLQTFANPVLETKVTGQFLIMCGQKCLVQPALAQSDEQA